jgi:hypothetical protein
MVFISDEGMPYYMTNKDWYYYDVKEGKDKLTSKATLKAIESYNEFYKDESLENGI